MGEMRKLAQNGVKPLFSLFSPDHPYEMGKTARVYCQDLLTSILRGLEVAFKRHNETLNTTWTLADVSTHESKMHSFIEEYCQVIAIIRESKARPVCIRLTPPPLTLSETYGGPLRGPFSFCFKRV